MKRTIYKLSALMLLAVFIACNEPFLNTVPKDALSPGTFWKTQKDVELDLTGCYRGFESANDILYRDCGSDNAYNNFPWEGWRNIANGTLSAADPGAGYFNYEIIYRCNDFLENIDKTKDFLSDEKIKGYAAQVRFLRAYRYYLLTTNYGDVPLVTKTFATPEESKIARNQKKDVESFIETELKDIIGTLPESHPAAQYGKATKGAAQTLLMRLYLHQGKNTEALATAKNIKGYSLFSSYTGLFDPENEQNPEVILSIQLVPDLYKLDYTPYLPNGTGGWSSVVPTQQLVDSYEMADGTTIAEATAAGTYDPKNPYVNRDPRLRASIIYPGQIWQGQPYKSVEAGNADHYKKADNASKTGYNFRKYLNIYDKNKNAAYWNSGADIFIFRYAEILLTIAETKNEISGPDAEVYDAIDAVRQRAGMPKVNREKYNSKEKLRELIRNERRVEFAMEGLRRSDILRWKIAPQVLNISMTGVREGKVLETKQANGDYNVLLTDEPIKVENRQFDEKKNYLLPISQSAIDKNPNLKPNNPGY